MPTDWTVTGVRQLSAIEKQQTRKIVVKYVPSLGYKVIITLKSNKTLDYPIGENNGYWIDDLIPKHNILIRKWQKRTHYKYDIIPIVDHE